MALPGVTTVLRDTFYALSRTNVPVGTSVLAIAARTTPNGTGGVQDYDPYRAIDEKNVIDTFGQGSPAHRAYFELVSAGAPVIYLVALPSNLTDTDLASTAAGNPLDTAFDAAEVVQPDVIVPWGRGGHPAEWEAVATPNDEPMLGFYADNSTNPDVSFAVRVADHCADISNRSHPCLAIMGVAPFNTADASPSPGANMTAAQVASHLGFPNLVSKEDASWNNGIYLSIVGAEVTPARYPIEWGFANGATSYAGTIAQLDAWSAPTGKPLFNVATLRYRPTRTQQENMIALGVMPVSTDYLNYPRWIDSATFARTGSDYSRLSTLRIVYDAVTIVRQVAQSYVGEAASLEHRNAFETSISSSLRAMQQVGALLSSNFGVQYDLVHNTANVMLVLTPASEIRTINVTVSVAL